MSQPDFELKPGIYRHYSGDLYFVFCVSTHTRTAEELVSYCPLYESKQCARSRPGCEFLEEVKREKFSGPRFVMVREWKSQAIIPGTKFRDMRMTSSSAICTIKQVVEREGKILIEIEDPDKGSLRSLSPEVFLLSNFQFV